MSAYTYLKSRIAAVIKFNGKKLITGDGLQAELFRMIDGMGGLELQGLARTTTVPGTPDKPLMYLAFGKGTFQYFNNLVVTEDLCFLCWNGDSWFKVATNMPTTGLQLGEDELTAGRGDWTKAAYDLRHTHNNKEALDQVSNTNTGDETKESLESKLGGSLGDKVDKVFGKGLVDLPKTTMLFSSNLLPEFSYTLAQWNTLFNTDKFLYLSIVDNYIVLYGESSDITMPNECFSGNIGLISFSTYNFSTLGIKAFRNCSQLVDFHSESVVSVYDNCFENCTSAVTFDFKDKLLNLGQNQLIPTVFLGITSIQNLLVPYSVRYYDDGVTLNVELEYVTQNNINIESLDVVRFYYENALIQEFTPPLDGSKIFEVTKFELKNYWLVYNDSLQTGNSEANKQIITYFGELDGGKLTVLNLSK